MSNPPNLNKSLVPDALLHDLAHYLYNKGVIINGRPPFAVTTQIQKLLITYFTSPAAQAKWGEVIKNQDTDQNIASQEESAA